MKHDLAWNSGKPYVPLTILWHTLLATVSRQIVFHPSSHFLCMELQSASKSPSYHCGFSIDFKLVQLETYWGRELWPQRPAIAGKRTGPGQPRRTAAAERSGRVLLRRGQIPSARWVFRRIGPQRRGSSTGRNVSTAVRRSWWSKRMRRREAVEWTLLLATSRETKENQQKPTNLVS